MQQPLFNWLTRRAAGVLLHPTCFPGDQGIGVLDHNARRFLRFLADSNITHWQTCPLGPTGYGDSPYQCFSVYAGNPYLIDLQALVEHGLLADDDIAPLRQLPRDRVDYGAIYQIKLPVLHLAYKNYTRQKTRLPYGSLDEFKKRHGETIEAFGLFLSLKDHFNGLPWWEWPAEFRNYQSARKQAAANTPDIIDHAEAHIFFQYLFFGQWRQLVDDAHALNIRIIGDAPIYVARDSADIWTYPRLFQTHPKTGLPANVAGVPPDYFSADGQLWGNPLYDWEANAAENYAWWVKRLRTNLEFCDILRIDHFRAFDTYWSIPAAATTAKNGKWQNGPGLSFFHTLKTANPEAKLIAEDLGDLTPGVHQLRAATGLPGMSVLQFAYGSGSENSYLPHNLTANNVLYPGTHDNTTTLDWYENATDNERDHVRRYLRVNGNEINWDFIRAAYASVSRLAIIPLQDMFGMGAAARFNTPGTSQGNWQWRYTSSQIERLSEDSAPYLRSLATLYARGLKKENPL